MKSVITVVYGRWIVIVYIVGLAVLGALDTAAKFLNLGLMRRADRKSSCMHISRQMTHPVHRLVARAFIGTPPTPGFSATAIMMVTQGITI